MTDIDEDMHTVAAGLIDLQLNGGWGNDFTTDPASIWEVGRHLPSTGVTTFLPTIVSAPYELVDSAIAVIQAGPPPGYVGAEPLGLHVEGPWLSPEWRGAHNPTLLRAPDLGVAARWAGSGVIRMVTIAPELEDAFPAAEILAAAGIVVSVGHTGADFETASRALHGPWTAVTHLFNQMSPFHHRAPGVVGAALDSGRPCGVIVDGIHSHPAAIRLAWDHLGPDRFVLVTDGMQATGLGPGRYLLGDQTVEVTDQGPRIGSDVLAGSTLTLDRAVANLLASSSASLDQALDAASLLPASLIGATDRGQLDSGRVDLTVFDRQLRVVKTTVDGLEAYPIEESR